MSATTATTTARQRAAVFLFSLVATAPFIITLFNLREEARIERILAGQPIYIDGVVERSGQREEDGIRAVYAEYTWNRDGRDFRGSARLNIPEVVRPKPGETIILVAQPGDPSFAVPSKIFREPGRLTHLKLLAGLFTLPPLAIWALLVWALLRERKQRGEPV